MVINRTNNQVKCGTFWSGLKTVQTFKVLQCIYRNEGKHTYTKPSNGMFNFALFDVGQLRSEDAFTAEDTLSLTMELH